MARKSDPKSASVDPHKTSKTPSRQLRQLEADIVEVLQRHASLVADWGTTSPEKVEKHFQKLLESRLDQLVSKSEGPLGETTLAVILRELISGERAICAPSRVAFLGPAHSYSHLATLEHFGNGADLVPVGSIASVFEEVASQQVTWGVVPIENSSDGRIVDTLEMFTKTRVQICGEVPLPIHHFLLGSGSRAGIAEVCSKPQAISQCRDWLASHLPQARVVPTSSTTAAAERAAEDPSVAAIASRQAGVEYGLKVLARNIEDKQNNVTRFAIIGQEYAARTGADKSSLMFELQHEPGALADAMAIFKRKGLNMTWIESLPKSNSPNEYLFFVELLGHPTDIRVKRALSLLEKKTVRLEVLGAYPQC